MEDVRYSGGIPNFSPCAAQTLRIDHMSKNRCRNFQVCDSACAAECSRRDGME